MNKHMFASRGDLLKPIHLLEWKLENPEENQVNTENTWNVMQTVTKDAHD